MLLNLGDMDAEDTVLHRGLDMVLIHAGWKGKASGELSNAALRNPELVLLLLWFRILLCNLSTLILNRSLVCLAIRALDGSWSSLAFDETGWWGARCVAALAATLDGQGVGVGELDLNILLLNAWEFAMKFVAVLGLLDIKLRSEGLELSAGTFTLAAVLIEVVEKAEERSEGGVGIGNEGSWEERHFASW